MNITSFDGYIISFINWQEGYVPCYVELFLRHVNGYIPCYITLTPQPPQICLRTDLQQIESKSIKCGHACRFGSPSAGSGPRLY